MARAWSLRFMIMTLSYSRKYLMEHRHLHDEAVVCFLLHDAARAVEHLIGDGGVASHRQAMHEAAVNARGREPAFPHAPVREGAPQARIGFGIAVGCRGAPLLRINHMSSRECFSALARLPY